MLRNQTKMHEIDLRQAVLARKRALVYRDNYILEPSEELSCFYVNDCEEYGIRMYQRKRNEGSKESDGMHLFQVKASDSSPCDKTFLNQSEADFAFVKRGFSALNATRYSLFCEHIYEQSKDGKKHENEYYTLQIEDKNGIVIVFRCFTSERDVAVCVMKAMAERDVGYTNAPDAFDEIRRLIEKCVWFSSLEY